jgi:hypothetical protein
LATTEKRKPDPQEKRTEDQKQIWPAMILTSSTKHKREGEDQNTQEERGTQREKKEDKKCRTPKNERKERERNNREL